MIVTPEETSRQRNLAITRLRALGAQASDGTLRGQVKVRNERLTAVMGVAAEPIQRFELMTPEQLRFSPPSLLEHAGAVSFMDLDRPDAFLARIEGLWADLARRTQQAVLSARQLSADAQLLVDPFRIEGSVNKHGEKLRLLFSLRGDRACISAVNGRPVVAQPKTPRVVLLTQTHENPVDLERRWRAAIEQAKACLMAVHGAPSKDEDQMSIDLATRDLELSYTPPAAPKPKYEAPNAPPKASGPWTAQSHESLYVPRMPPPPVAKPTVKEREASLDLSSADLP